MSRIFGYKDLLHLYKDLDEVAAKWDSFGVQLGIPYGKLQGFRGGASKADRCFTGLLEAWLRGQETNDRSNAINQLVSALRMPGVDQGGLANEIDQNRDDGRVWTDGWTKNTAVTLRLCYSARINDYGCAVVAAMREVQLELRYLSDRLSTCKASWFLLGIGLEIDEAELRGLEGDQDDRGVNSYLFDVLKYWLTSGEDNVRAPNIHTLTDALTKIKHRNLAAKMKLKYSSETTVTAKSPKAGSTNSSTAELNQGGVKMMAAEPIMVSQSPGFLQAQVQGRTVLGSVQPQGLAQSGQHQILLGSTAEEMQMPQLPPGNITTIAPAAKSNLVPKATQFQGTINRIEFDAATGAPVLPTGQQCMARGEVYPSKRWNLEVLHSQPINLQGDGVVIAILDGAADVNHLSMQGKIIHTENFVGEFVINHMTQCLELQPLITPNIYDQHGTAVAAVAGGRSFNFDKEDKSQIVIPEGIAPGASLLICRVFHDRTLYNAAQALQYLLNLKRSGTQIDIICMSFTMESSEKIEAILSDLAKEKIACVASAGNDGSYQNGAGFPASDGNVLSVGALTPRGKTDCDLNPDHGIDVYANGEDIVIPLLDPSRNDMFIRDDGTSYAAPMVAGFLALLIQCVKGLGATPAVIRKFHDINFLKKLFRDHRLCEQNKLIRAERFLNQLLKGNHDPTDLIKEYYRGFDPNA